ncbi:MAG: hypothetical protein LAT56_14555 [Wenzhouxiangella sp.]|nr:hypothetical protein [Wenzhouxiangella sp.]
MSRNLKLLHRLTCAFGLALLATACGEVPPAASPASPERQASSQPAGADRSAALEGIVVRVAAGGRPDAFCIPEWSIANQTRVDIPGLLIRIEWRHANGEVLQAAGESGTFTENLSAGRVVDRTLSGYTAACDQIRIVVGDYACRDDSAVRVPCPGPLHVLTEGGITADLSGLREGSMRGAVEA